MSEFLNRAMVGIAVLMMVAAPLRAADEEFNPELPLAGKLDPRPTWKRRLLQSGVDGAKATGTFLKESVFWTTRGLLTGGIGFIIRQAKDEELKKLDEKRWTESWYEKAAPLRLPKTENHAWYKRATHTTKTALGRVLWPYQWPVRAVTRATVGEQYIVTPGRGIADNTNRVLRSCAFSWLVGPLHLTKPAEFLVKLAPFAAGLAGITYVADKGQEAYLEHQIQGPWAPMLDEEIQNDVLMKPIKMSLKNKQETPESARRKAYKVLRETADYHQRIDSILTKEMLEDDDQVDAFVMWSLKLNTFEDLASLSVEREIDVDVDRYLYDLDFMPEVDADQLRKLVFNRHVTLYRVRGADALINEVTKKHPGLKVDDAGNKLKESKVVQEVLARLKDGRLDEKKARNWMHVYIDWQQELKQMEILKFSKRVKENGEFTDRKLTLEDVEQGILLKLDKEK